jgi:hypothetical protein
VQSIVNEDVAQTEKAKQEDALHVSELSLNLFIVDIVGLALYVQSVGNGDVIMSDAAPTTPSKPEVWYTCVSACFCIDGQSGANQTAVIVFFLLQLPRESSALKQASPLSLDKVYLFCDPSLLCYSVCVFLLCVFGS